MTLHQLLRVADGVLGAAMIAGTLSSAITTVVLPRGVNSRLSRVVFVGMRLLFRLRAGRAPSFERRDAVFANYAPFSLLVLLQVWLAVTWLGFALLQMGVADLGARAAVVLSGSSLLTLGFTVPRGVGSTLAVFVEASLGLVLLALLITYLPSLYASFSRREALVAKLEVRAGSPSSGAELLWRAYTLGSEETLLAVLQEWESWFVDVEETHTSFPSLAFFRSPQPDLHWVTAAGAVLDAASLRASIIDGPRMREAELALRAGYLALRRIGSYHNIPFPADPQPGDPVAVTRAEFDAAVSRVAAAGAPIRGDRDAAWRDFAGWRVNYDVPLIALAALTQAPYAPWSSDRSLTRHQRGTPTLRAALRRPGLPAPRGSRPGR